VRLVLDPTLANLAIVRCLVLDLAVDLLRDDGVAAAEDEHEVADGLRVGTARRVLAEQGLLPALGSLAAGGGVVRGGKGW